MFSEMFDKNKVVIINTLMGAEKHTLPERLIIIKKSVQASVWLVMDTHGHTP